MNDSDEIVRQKKFIMTRQREFHESMIDMFGMDALVEALVTGIAERLVSSTKSYEEAVELGTITAETLSLAIKEAAKAREENRHENPQKQD